MSFIQDPFDLSEAIAPSGKRAAKVFFAPVGTDPTSLGTSDEWRQIGWSEPLDLTPKLIPPPPKFWRPDTPSNGARDNE